MDRFIQHSATQGLRKRKPFIVFGLNQPNPNRFNCLPILWLSDVNNQSVTVEGYTVTEATIRQLFNNAAKEAAIAVKQLPSHDSEDGFGASAVVIHNGKKSIISAHNNKVPRLDEGYRAYCAEVQTLLKAATPIGEKGFIPLMVVVNDEAPTKSGVRYAPCGPCLNEIRSAVLGTHPTARMSPKSLVAFVDTQATQPAIVIRPVHQLLPIQAITSHSTMPVWKMRIQPSPRAQKALESLPHRWLFNLTLRLGIATARWRAQHADTYGLNNKKGPSIGAAILKKTWYGYRFISGSNAYTNGRSYAPPFQNIMEQLPAHQRTQLLGGILISANDHTRTQNSGNKNPNVINLGDMDLLAYTAKNKEALIITVNGPTIHIQTYLDYVPYPYHRAHHVKK